MTKYKMLKDPIYGYISVPLDYMTNIIDTSYFQRLRRIIQTSFAPLYSSAVHNRFVHSIGVFHLGNIVKMQLEKEILCFSQLPDYVNKDYINRLGDIFSLACLLHDVGHAPFSHTGEEFYLNKKEKNDSNKEKQQVQQYSNIHNILDAEVGNESFSTDIKHITDFAAPHEIVSACVGIKEFSDMFFNEPEEKEFFARCITGYKYSDNNKSIENCYIEMLNSKIIDVDKLDYLVRDAYITGFDTVRIDYLRLLNSVTFHYDEIEEKFSLAYYKSAISVIENVIYAHDAERKWIQTHPIVLYDGYIIHHIIEELNGKFNDNLFSIEAIGNKGKTFTYDHHEEIFIKLLCDDDIISLAKSHLNDSLTNEYFERNNRRHPIWKSEAEYSAYIKECFGDTVRKQVKKAITTMLESMEGSRIYSIDETYINKINDELKKLEKQDLQNCPETNRLSFEAQKRGKTSVKKVCDGLLSYTKKYNEDLNFIFLKSSQFCSGFSKTSFDDINIKFEINGEQTVLKFKKLINVLDASSNQDEFYYIYTKTKNHDGNQLELYECIVDEFKKR